MPQLPAIQHPDYHKYFKEQKRQSHLTLPYGNFPLNNAIPLREQTNHYRSLRL